ncbi:MAG: DNA-binding response regulator [Halobacteriovoraceae bacterium]|nr:DNA-binding response regulator [Halobacteriovoraceae bacterium]|tara:strand:- start:18450 stop:19160 length:711 start_codon:yes stop_codon:yes gene_type:complete
MTNGQKKKILLIDDDYDIHDLIRHTLSREFELSYAEYLNEGESLIKKNPFDLLILDETLPDGRGSDLCHKLKNELDFNDLQIIMLTQRKDLKDKLNAFDAGADDYVSKPFEPLELVARINARLRGTTPGHGNILEKYDLKLELTTLSLSILEKEGEDNWQEISLTPIEFKILYQLIKDEGVVKSRQELLESVWGKGQNVIDRTVDQHVSKLRKKLGPSVMTVKSLHKKGYLLAEEM